MVITNTGLLSRTVATDNQNDPSRWVPYNNTRFVGFELLTGNFPNRLIT